MSFKQSGGVIIPNVLDTTDFTTLCSFITELQQMYANNLNENTVAGPNAVFDRNLYKSIPKKNNRKIHRMLEGDLFMFQKVKQKDTSKILKKVMNKNKVSYSMVDIPMKGKQFIKYEDSRASRLSEDAKEEIINTLLRPPAESVLMLNRVMPDSYTEFKGMFKMPTDNYDVCGPFLYDTFVAFATKNLILAIYGSDYVKIKGKRVKLCVMHLLSNNMNIEELAAYHDKSMQKFFPDLMSASADSSNSSGPVYASLSLKKSSKKRRQRQRQSNSITPMANIDFSAKAMKPDSSSNVYESVETPLPKIPSKQGVVVSTRESKLYNGSLSSSVSHASIEHPKRAKSAKSASKSAKSASKSAKSASKSLHLYGNVELDIPLNQLPRLVFDLNKVNRIQFKNEKLIKAGDFMICWDNSKSIHILYKKFITDKEEFSIAKHEITEDGSQYKIKKIITNKGNSPRPIIIENTLGAIIKELKLEEKQMISPKNNETMVNEAYASGMTKGTKKKKRS